jgi:hypothetical protein
VRGYLTPITANTTASAEHYFASLDWINSGGDRTWISPEIETKVRDPADLANSFDVPKAMDPADYAVASSDENSVTLRTEKAILFRNSRVPVELWLTNAKPTLGNPPLVLADAVSCAGYQVETELTSVAGVPERVRPAIYSLLLVLGGVRSAFRSRVKRSPAHSSVSRYSLKR